MSDERAATFSLPQVPRFWIARLGWAIAFTAAALATTFLLHGLEIGQAELLVFCLAVMASVWSGGIEAGIVAAVLSTLAVDYFWLPPIYSLSLDTELPAFAAFVLVGLMSLGLSIQRVRAEHALRRERNTLEARVRRRTLALERANDALRAENAERQRTERALSEMEADFARVHRLMTMSELTASIAHEINQPLAAIVINGAAALRSLTQHPPDFAEAGEALSEMVCDANRASGVIERVRALLNSDAPERVPLDLNGAIADVLALSGRAIEGAAVSVRTELAAGLPPVSADPVLLRQVLMNLITNAVEAMRGIEGRPRAMTMRSGCGRRNRILITLEDTGIGVDPAALDRVFERFYTTKAGGIGMGLAISRSIVEDHGGALWASPGVPHGMVFHLALPVEADT
jgi:C4-dicarboxylate-specific signal transduction histidine kinase